MKGRHGVVLAVVAGLVLTGCVGSVSRGDFDDEVRSRGGGLSQDHVEDGLVALEDELGAGDLRFRSITLHPGYAVFVVLLPGRDGEVDSYTYGSSGLYGGGEGLSEGRPDQSLAPEEAQQAFRAERAPIGGLEDLVDAAVAAADLPGGYAATAGITRAGDGPPELRVTVESERRSVTVVATADGELEVRG